MLRRATGHLGRTFRFRSSHTPDSPGCSVFDGKVTRILGWHARGDATGLNIPPASLNLGLGVGEKDCAVGVGRVVSGADRLDRVGLGADVAAKAT